VPMSQSASRTTKRRTASALFVWPGAPPRVKGWRRRRVVEEKMSASGGKRTRETSLFRALTGFANNSPQGSSRNSLRKRMQENRSGVFRSDFLFQRGETGSLELCARRNGVLPAAIQDAIRIRLLPAGVCVADRPLPANRALIVCPVRFELFTGDRLFCAGE
jgi:hypothetical protein